jgi:hypothetical protein
MPASTLATSTQFNQEVESASPAAAAMTMLRGTVRRGSSNCSEA